MTSGSPFLSPGLSGFAPDYRSEGQCLAADESDQEASLCSLAASFWSLATPLPQWKYRLEFGLSPLNIPTLRPEILGDTQAK